MNAILAALVACALAFLIERVMLQKHARRLKASEQAFRFHAIRDELQLLAMHGEVRTDSRVYQFLLWTANVAIHNAGVFKIRDMIAIAHQVRTRMEVVAASRSFDEAVKAEPKAVQHITGETFDALAAMLVANDALVRMGWSCSQVASGALHGFRVVIRPLIRTIDALAASLVPHRLEAVYYAREYSGIAAGLERVA
jgi:hypothetical protein